MRTFLMISLTPRTAACVLFSDRIECLFLICPILFVAPSLVKRKDLSFYSEGWFPLESTAVPIIRWVMKLLMESYCNVSVIKKLLPWAFTTPEACEASMVASWRGPRISGLTPRKILGETMWCYELVVISSSDVNCMIYGLVEWCGSLGDMTILLWL